MSDASQASQASHREPAVWHHVWATVVLQETFDCLVERGQVEIAHLIERHLDEARSACNRAIDEAAELDRQLRDGD